MAAKGKQFLGASANQFLAEAQQQVDENRQKRIEMENTLQAVAQMRKAQTDYFRCKDNKRKQDMLIEAKKLEAAVDMRLSQLEIKAVG